MKQKRLIDQSGTKNHVPHSTKALSSDFIPLCFVQKKKKNSSTNVMNTSSNQGNKGKKTMEQYSQPEKNAKVAPGCKNKREKLEQDDFLLRHSRDII